MNFIREVIDIVSENEVADTRSNLKSLIKEIKGFQGETRSFIEDHYNEFTYVAGNNQLYLDKANHLTAEVNQIYDRIESETRNDLLAVAADVQQYMDELQEIAIGLRINHKLLQIDELLKQLEVAKSCFKHIRVKEIITQLRHIIYDSTDEEIFKRTECYRNIKIRLHIEHELLLNTLQNRFELFVQMTEKTFQNTKSVTLRISKDQTALREIVTALFNSNSNAQKLCKFLMANIFEPIVNQPVSLEYKDKDIGNDSSEEHASLTLSYSLKPMITSNNQVLRPNYKIVFKNVMKTFLCLNHLNVVINDEISVIEVLAETIKTTLLKMIINECITYSIPETIDEMNSSELVSDVLELNKFLKKCGFLSETDAQLTDFAEKINVIFKKRFCENILNSAVELMHRDLHDMQIVKDVKTEHDFPRCMISRSTIDLIGLLEEVLREAADFANGTKSVSVIAEKYVIDDIHEILRSTVPIILERYITEVAHTHEKLLQTIPQQAALFHNNCQYLAYWLEHTEHSGILPSEKAHTLVVNLQELGSEHFAMQIKNQRTQLIDILKEFDLSESITELGPQPVKIVRQCLRQLDLLKNVWQTILPEAVYTRTIGLILNDFCSEIIRKIVSREDISSSVANNLVEICDTIIERASYVFEDPLQVSIHVKNWVKLQQLKMILNSSMVNIVDHWADGKGPFTMHYKAEEIRHLIRALFQNTDHRASALAAID